MANRHPVLLSCFVVAAACSELPPSTSVEVDDKQAVALASGTARDQESPAGSKPIEVPAMPKTAGEELVMQWALSSFSCGSDDSSKARTADEIMAAVPSSSERADAIGHVLLTSSLSSPRAEALVSLLAETKDPRAFAIIKRFYSEIGAAVERNLDNFDDHARGTEDEVEAMRSAEARYMRRACMRGAALLAKGRKDVVDFLYEGSTDPEESVRLAALTGLKKHGESGRRVDAAIEALSGPARRTLDDDMVRD